MINTKWYYLLGLCAVEAPEEKLKLMNWLKSFKLVQICGDVWTNFGPTNVLYAMTSQLREEKGEREDSGPDGKKRGR